MTSEQPTVSVVVSTYSEDRWQELRECLQSLAGQTRPPQQTILVVDHNDELLARAEDAFPEVTVVPNIRPRGLAGARNSGVDVATAEVIAFVDDDARADTEWLEHLASCFIERDVVGAGGALSPWWQGKEAGWMPREFYWVIGCSYTGLPDKRAPVRNPIGANMAVRTSVLRAVDGFRQGSVDDAPRALRSRGVVRAAGNVPDDTDFAIRVKQRIPDAVWLYEPRARVLHAVTPERASLGYFLRRSYEEGVGKAHLARSVGADQGLSSERRHLVTVLPRGVLRGLRDTLGGDLQGLLRSAAIVVGLAAAALGFVVTSGKGAAQQIGKGNLDDPQTAA